MSRRGTSWFRCFSSTLAKWLREWAAVPPVVVAEGVEPPTALSWLRRRGPPLPEAALHKLFRCSTVRVYDPATQRVSRAARARPLPPGATLLLPKAAVAPLVGDGGAAAPPRRAASPAQARGAEGWAARLRAGLLHTDPDFLAVDKPAGLACQGGRGVSHSVDACLAAAFAGQPGLDASQLRLVHRLDRQTTGALLLARGADAAAWLAAAFRAGAAAGAGGGASIGKTYWAVVALPPGGRRPPASGSISLPVPGGGASGGGAARPLAALTRYRLLRAGGGLAWLELAPVTGRKHQLRLHCARGLGAPILGDARYGQLRSPAQAAPLAALRSGGGGGEPPLFLHCRSLVVERPGGGTRAAVTAPLPAAWRALLDAQGWPLPPA